MDRLTTLLAVAAAQYVYYRPMLCKRGPYAIMQCLSVCLSVCHVRTFCQNFEMSSKNVSPSGSHIILVFRYQTGLRYFDGNLPNGGVECRWGRQNRDSEPISGFTACC